MVAYFLLLFCIAMEIRFTAVAGDEVMQVSLSNPSGNGDDMSFHIMIDNYYQGVLAYRRGEWIGFLNGNSWLERADIMILGEIVDEYLAEN